MLKVTLYNPGGLSGTAFTLCEEEIFLIKSRVHVHEYIVLCKDIPTLNSFLLFSGSKTDIKY